MKGSNSFFFMANEQKNNDEAQRTELSPKMRALGASLAVAAIPAFAAGFPNIRSKIFPEFISNACTALEEKTKSYNTILNHLLHGVTVPGLALGATIVGVAFVPFYLHYKNQEQANTPPNIDDPLHEGIVQPRKGLDRVV
ncbi:MAG: hypothetical protein EAY65_06500 [Alphaproteobacteria bacterium]|nr:MAG: hypothetical protein EAY65_06500 [Alphaproteobacteria bacterium]